MCTAHLEHILPHLLPSPVPEPSNTSHSHIPFVMWPTVSVSAACMSMGTVPSTGTRVTYPWSQPPNDLPFPIAIEYQVPGGGGEAPLLWVVECWVAWSPTSGVGSIIAPGRSWAPWPRHVHRTACHSTPWHLLVLHSFFFLFYNVSLSRGHLFSAIWPVLSCFPLPLEALWPSSLSGAICGYKHKYLAEQQ